MTAGSSRPLRSCSDVEKDGYKLLGVGGTAIDGMMTETGLLKDCRKFTKLLDSR